MTHPRKTLAPAAAALLLAGACAHDDMDKELTPTPVVEGTATNDEATAIADNVVVKLDGDPDLPVVIDVEEEITPLFVSIENDSGLPLRIRYQDMALEDGAMRYEPLPPHNFDVVEEPPEALYRYDGFFLAPSYVSTYAPYKKPGDWDGPFDQNDAWYVKQYARWGNAEPTREMLSHALPEGVLSDGGSVSGLVYFYNLPKPASTVTFDMLLVDAYTGETIDSIEMPFLIQPDDPDLARGEPVRDDG